MVWLVTEQWLQVKLFRYLQVSRNSSHVDFIQVTCSLGYYVKYICVACTLLNGYNQDYIFKK